MGPCQGLEETFDSLKRCTMQREVWILTEDPPATLGRKEGVMLSLCNLDHLEVSQDCL